MTRSSILTLLILCPALMFSQRSSAPQTGGNDVYVYVTFEHEKPAGISCRVTLFTTTRQRVGEEFTNDRGLAIFRGVKAGDYRLVAGGTNIEEAESAITVYSHGGYDSTQNEHIEVKLIKKDAEQNSSAQASVSVTTLNIPDKARKEFEKGLAAFDKQDFPTARERFTKAVDLYPQYCGALLDLGVIAMQEGHADEGKHYFERATQADPQNPAGYVYLARVDIVRKDYKDAEPLLAKALAISPLDPEPLTLLASSQLQLGELDQAVANAKKVHAVPHQQFAIAHYIAAQALLKESQPAQAADEFRLYLQESPQGPNAAAAKAALASINPQK